MPNLINKIENKGRLLSKGTYASCSIKIKIEGKEKCKS
jgi:putative lipoic acid-binding regulatory protein